MSMIVDRRDLDFILFDLLGMEDLLRHERFAAFDRDACTQMLDTAQQIAEDHFLPIAAEVDANEPRFVGGRVEMPEGTGHALRACAEAGFFALPFAQEHGGLQAPRVLHTAASGIFTCANTAVANYAFLTVGAANLLAAFGSEPLRRRFLPPMLEGRWFGTMCLSEPQAGSSLADITTTATPRADGTFSLRGSKMWISGGDQEISENIVHMVLARIAGAPAGTRGISLFLVPKRRVDESGAVGESNNIALAGLNHKMGQRGTTNCLLNFGESGETIGHLIGAPHRGLEYMFQMMNEARIGVGLAAAMLGMAGFEASLAYARQRPQGRPVGPAGKDPSLPPVAIIEHADVKRMLLAQKAYAEGALALELYCARLVDEHRTGAEASARDAGLLLDVLTPIAKSWPSEWCLEANSLAIQVLGGYGYTRDFPVEQYWRDNRLNMIHEGTHGIQALDLLGRKVVMQGGAGLDLLAARVRATTTGAEALPALQAWAAALNVALQHLLVATRAAWEGDNPAATLANATPYMQAFGHVVLGWIWLDVALVAQAHLQRTNSPDFHHGKLQACRYFFAYELPKIQAWLQVAAQRDPTCREMRDAWF